MNQWIQQQMDELNAYQARRNKRFPYCLFGNKKLVNQSLMQLNEYFEREDQQSSLFDSEMQEKPLFEINDNDIIVKLTNHYLLLITGTWKNKTYRLILLSDIISVRGVMMKDPYKVKNQGKEYYINICGINEKSLGCLILKRDKQYKEFLTVLNKINPAILLFE